MSFSHILLFFFFFFFFFFFLQIVITIAQYKAVGSFCTPNNTYTPNSIYQTNLEYALSIITSNTNITYGFYNFFFGQIPDTVHTIALCRGDIDLNTCQSCVMACAAYLTHMCPDQKEAYGWFDVCMFRYSNYPIYHYWDTTAPGFFLVNSDNASQPDQFEPAMWKLLEKVAPIAINGDSQSKFGTGSAPAPNNSTIYFLVQCTPDLNAQQCNNCLAASGSEFGRCCSGRIGASIFKASCTLRYDTTLFYGDVPAREPPPTFSVTIQPQRPPYPPSPFSPDLGKTRKGITTTTVILIVFVAVLVSAKLIIGICIWIWFFRRKQKQQKLREKFNATEYEPNEIRLATSGFSEENKLGQGTFGAVYKGVLEDGTRIAVKKLINYSTTDEQDLKNEVLLLGKLTHMNLVRLLGYSQDGTGFLLIYEFVPNGTLDNFIYGNVQTSNYDWNTLYKIIEGIAKGLVYLHIDSELHIIHRDLKPCNILLDENMNPKIADFGTARLLALDATHRSTIKFMGTFGYIAPEYFRLFQYSMKTDVYSFGVIVLEIISGQRVNQYSVNDNLLSFAWRNRQEDTLSNLINAALRIEDSRSLKSIRRCIQIGLLCVQENAVDRPTMKSVYEWLTNHFTSLAEPSRPAYFVSTDHPPSLILDSEYDSIHSNNV